MISLIRLLRPKQWTKNAFCLAGLVFSGRFTDPSAIRASLLVFVIFCAASSAVYIFNDLSDIESDRSHPKKKYRPLARGAVSKPAALGLAIVLLLLVLAGQILIGASSWACVAIYLATHVAYSLGLKRVPLIDVLCIALGFVLRLLAGIYAIHEIPTTWVTLCTLFLALFLGFSKRRAELAGLKSANQSHQRPVLGQYSVPLLDSLVSSTATMTVLCYALFTAISGKNPTLVVTVPIVHYAVMHYKMLLMNRGAAEEPDAILLTDRGIQISIMLWFLCYLVVVYGNLHLFR